MNTNLGKIENTNLDEIREIAVDGMTDPSYPHIEYWGKATRQEDGSWVCYADVGGSLCLVKVNIILKPSIESKSS